MSLAWSCCRFGSLASTFTILMVPAALLCRLRIDVAQSSPDARGVRLQPPASGTLKPRRLMSLSTSDQFSVDNSLYPGRQRLLRTTLAPVAQGLPSPPCTVRLLLLKTSLDVDSIHPHAGPLIQVDTRGRTAPLGKLIVPTWTSTGATDARRYRCVLSQQPPQSQIEVAFGRPCRYSSGINSATFLVLLTNSGSSRLSNSLLGIAGLAAASRCIVHRTQRKPPGSAVSVPIAGI